MAGSNWLTTSPIPNWDADAHSVVELRFQQSEQVKNPLRRANDIHVIKENEKFLALLQLRFHGDHAQTEEKGHKRVALLSPPLLAERWCHRRKEAHKRVRYTSIQMRKKNSSKNIRPKPFHPKTEDTFIQKWFRPMTFSSKTGFIQ